MSPDEFGVSVVNRNGHSFLVAFASETFQLYDDRGLLVGTTPHHEILVPMAMAYLAMGESSDPQEELGHA